MLGRLLFRQSETRSVVVRSSAGYFGTVSEGTIEPLRSSAVWACTDVLAGSISSLPIDVVRPKLSTRETVTTPSLLTNPSGIVTLDVWLYQIVYSMVHDGNAFGLITSVDGASRPKTIETLDAGAVSERKVVDGVPQARVNGKIERVYPYGDLFHIPGKMVRPGSPFGLSPIEYAAEAIRAGLAAERFGSGFFDDGGHPSSIVYSDQELTPEQALDVKKAYVDATRGNREPAVMGSGLKVEQIQVNPSDSQFLELQRFVVETVARFCRVPPAMVYAAMSGQSVTYANATQADLHYLKHSLDGYLVRIEQALSALLPKPRQVKFNRSALLRADAESRHKVFDMRLKNQTITVNEVRALEDEEPLEGDEFNHPTKPPTPAAPVAPAPKPQEGDE